jgi:NDP-sugar pyrophosphorylase family protein
MMPVAILAGGLASRLGEVARSIPKSLLNIAGHPFIFWQLELLKQAGLTDIVICIGHLGEQIRKVLGTGIQLGLRIRYSQDGDALLGTGGTLRNAVSLLGSDCFVLYGDSYLDCDYRAIELTYRCVNTPGLMVIHHNRNHWDRSNVLFHDDMIQAYSKTPTSDMEHIDYGLGILKTSVIQQYPHTQFDLADIYQDLISRKQLAAYEESTRFYEIGSFRGYQETWEHIAKRISNASQKP